MFNESREKYKDNVNKFLIAKVIDKYEFCKTKNKITYTDFLDISQKSIIKKFIKEEKISNYVFYGGKENSDREILIFYPDKLSNEFLQKNYNKILNIIKIKLPNEISYEHREFLSGIMKLGVKREKFGDIIVLEDGAEIICLSEISEYLKNNLQGLTRFKKSKISIKDMNDLTMKENEFENIKIIVSSNRLDSFVSELAKCSRSKASEIIKEGRVFVNSINEFKDSKKVNIGDIITIRGKGKFIFESVEKETRSGNNLLNINKYK